MSRKYTRRIRRRRVKKGGDIESGTVENVSPMTSIPPDPERFKAYQERIVRELNKPISKEEAASVFAGPNPQQKLQKEQEMMGNEDPLNKDPFVRDDLSIFNDKGGRRTRKRRNKKNKRKNSRRSRR